MHYSIKYCDKSIITMNPIKFSEFNIQLAHLFTTFANLTWCWFKMNHFTLIFKIRVLPILYDCQNGTKTRIQEVTTTRFRFFPQCCHLFSTTYICQFIISGINICTRTKTSNFIDLCAECKFLRVISATEKVQ